MSKPYLPSLEQHPNALFVFETSCGVVADHPQLYYSCDACYGQELLTEFVCDMPDHCRHRRQIVLSCAHTTETPISLYDILLAAYFRITLWKLSNEPVCLYGVGNIHGVFHMHLLYCSIILTESRRNTSTTSSSADPKLSSAEPGNLCHPYKSKELLFHLPQ